MSFTQVDLDKSTIFGTGEINRVRLPQLTARNRRKNPDMGSTVPYYSALTGKTVNLEIGGDVAYSTSITFTSDTYQQALLDISTTGAGDFEGVDYNGFLTIRSTHPGNKNFIRINGGTALSILGFEAHPHPAGISYAGEIATPYPTTYENRTKGESVILQNESINRENWNRGLAGVGHILDTMLNNLDKEIAVPKEYDVTINGSTFSIASSDRLCINANNLTVAQPSADQIDNVVCVLDQFHNQIFDATDNRVQVNSITYGTLVDATQSFASWNTADGKSVFGALSHFQKTKGTYTITSISGNTVRLTGGNLVTDKIGPNDTIVISGATNITPFSHNGEFIVDRVLATDLLQVRPKGTTDFNMFASSTPTSLNQVLGLGEVYGTMTIHVGKFLPLAMKSANMVFNLSASLPNGTYKVRMPIGRTLKQLLQEDISAADIISPYGGQIELGSKLVGTLANALKPRIISKPNTSVTKTLLGEFFSNTTVGAVGLRIYTNRAGGLELVYNGKWDGATFNKDDAGQDIVFINLTNTVTAGTSTNQLKVDSTAGTVTAKMTTAFNVDDASTTVLSVPDFDGLVTSQIDAKSGIKLGTGFTTDNQHLIEKVNYKSNTGAGKYTLLTETNLSGPKRREYVTAEGYRVDTFNARRNGAQWIKDSSSISSIKSVIDNRGHFEYIYNGTGTPFNETDWNTVNDFKDYQFNEDFTARLESALVNSIGSLVGSNFRINSANNLNYSTNTLSLGFGEIRTDSIAAGAFESRILANTLNFGLADFVLILRARCYDKSLLETDALDGFIMGSRGSALSEYLLLRTGSDLTSWKVQIGASVIDTMILNNASPITIMFEKYGSTIKTYANKTLIDTRSYTASQDRFLPDIIHTGTATGAIQGLVNIDTFKLWYGENNYN